MNMMNILVRGTICFTLGVGLWTGAGCKHTSRKSPKPASETQSSPVVKNSRSSADPTEKRFQEQINLMQEQIGILTARTEALARFHGPQMGPKWVGKVQAARASESRASERMRYLEASKALLARKLQALRTELKVYEEFELSDPALPRP